MKSTSPDVKPKLLIIFLVVLTLITFSPAFNAEFLSWDDSEYITGNPVIKELSLHNIKKMFLPIAGKDYIITPLVFLSFAVEHALFGMNPAVFHGVNVFLHTANVLLVLYLFHRLTNNCLIAFVTAVLFAVHPMRVESVLWAIERKDMLSTLFFMASLISYFLYLVKNRGICYVMSLVSFALSILSKPTVITLPAILILIDYVLGKQCLSKKRLMEKIPFFCVTFFVIILTLTARRRPSQG